MWRSSVSALQTSVIDALAQAAALREQDAALYPSDPRRLEAANRLHDAWRRWLEGAEALLARIHSTRSNDAAISGTNELQDVVGWTGAMLQLSPTVIAERYKQAARGEVYTREQLRRELQLGNRR
jgi:hypothetical protein